MTVREHRSSTPKLMYHQKEALPKRIAKKVDRIVQALAARHPVIV